MSSWWSSDKNQSKGTIEADDASVWSNPFTKVASNQSLDTTPSRSTEAGGASSWSNPFRSNTREQSSSNSGGGFLGGGSGSRWINVDTENLSYARGELTGENSEFKQWGIDLTRQQRIMGFVGCLISGFVISLLGTILFIVGSHAAFAVLFSIGVMISLIGTGFLIGFMRQLKQMFKPVRIVATGMMIAFFVMVWVAAFALNIGFLALIFCVLLYLSYIYYALSYIPYATQAINSFFKKLW